MMVLLVEDDILIAATLKEFLSDAGHQVCGPADTIAKALDVVRLVLPDLALLNIDLADGRRSGVTLARRLRQEWGIWSLFVSGQRNDAYTARDIALGYISKPYDPGAVVHAVEVAGLLRQGHRVAPEMIPPGLELF